MHHLIEEFEENLGHNKPFMLVVSIIKIVLSALLQTFVMQVFMNPCNLISGGFTGIALFINRLGNLAGVDVPTSLLIICSTCRSPCSACARFPSGLYSFR